MKGIGLKGWARIALPLAALGAWLAAGPALAQAAAPAAPWKPDSGDTAWMLTSTALVLLMTIPGLALFYGGMVRKKNVIATVAQSFAITCLVTVIWMVVGYSAAFTTNPNPALNKFIGGFGEMFLHGVGVGSSNALAGTIPEYVFMMFQMTFAIITPALIAGAFAERMKFSALLLFMTLWSLAVYTPIAHWVWGGGFLGSKGVLDFAGGTVVHINAGVAGLVCALVMGKRKGFGHDNMAPHNLIYTMIGASLLWVGWFGFNAGSAVASNALAGAAMVNTQVATAAAALAWMVVEWIERKKPGILGLCSGAVAGLVAITPASGFVNPQGALILGLVAGVVCYAGAVWIKKIFKYDDSLDAFGVHGIGGIVGALLTGVLADAAINPAGKDHSLLVQAEGVIVTIAWTAVVTFIILMICKFTVGLRPSEEAEIEGLDVSLHGETIHE
ncbi:ammonia channel protein [Caulobacter sp. CCUG 60055]|uniref:ammonium transporter n=1 Tax=Caulobacter sp. CCUG 60055 TaxID=2100090 RepID=UPI0003C1B0B7|nr:ammonium transporter [Caulobacter sp. CCUG 60055]MCI3182224.1 ammonia channel protein [Caulobacter sp. CCUG 60055]